MKIICLFIITSINKWKLNKNHNMIIYVVNLLLLYLTFLLVYTLEQIQNKNRNYYRFYYCDYCYERSQSGPILDLLHDVRIVDLVNEYLRYDYEMYRILGIFSSVLLDTWFLLFVCDVIFNSNYHILGMTIIGCIIRNIMRICIRVDNLDGMVWINTHPNFLGLRFSSLLISYETVHNFLFSGHIFFSLVWCLNLSSFLYHDFCGITTYSQLAGYILYIAAILTVTYQIIFVIATKLQYSIGIYLTIVTYIVLRTLF